MICSRLKLGSGLALAGILFALLLPPAARAYPPAILKWAEVHVPGAKGNIIVSPSEVSRIAVSRGDIIYAIDSANNKIYRSENGGLTWFDITSALSGAGAVLPAEEIAVAPDRPLVVSVVTNNRTKVFSSTDSGATWNDTNIPALTGAIQCVTISRAYASGTDLAWDVAIGTAEWGNATTTGQVWVFQLGVTAASWQNQAIKVDPTHTGAEVSALAFSPSYGSDGAILAVASTAADVAPAYQNRTWLCLGKRDTVSSTTQWNSDAGYPGYPVEIATATSPSQGDAPGVAGIVSSIALPSNYIAALAPTSRRALASYDRQPSPLMDASDDVYRLDDTQVFRLNVAGGAAIDLSSISYYGTIESGRLLAGDVKSATLSPPTVQVRRYSDPLATTPPTPSWQPATQPPTGPGNARVSWGYDGKTAYCSTGQSPGVALDESAFSRSTDYGDTWEQVSLIDTAIRVSDIAPVPESKGLFLATYSEFGPESVWRSAGEPLGNFWGRVLTLNATNKNRLILRLSPNYIIDYTIYVAEVEVEAPVLPQEYFLLAVSNDRGNSWHQRRVPGPVIDLAIEDRDTAYVALPGGRLRKTASGGQIWQGAFGDLDFDINMLAVTEEGHILVGSRDSKVAYSTDRGASFAEIPEVIGNGHGDVQVAADAAYARNSTIYAATNNKDQPDDGIWRWTIGRSTKWEQIDESVTNLGTGERISGLLTGKEGTLYALRLEPVDGAGGGGMNRSLNPLEPYAREVEFDVVNRTLPAGAAFDPTVLFPSNTMPHLKMSAAPDYNELWALDIHKTPADDIVTFIYRFQDNLCKAGPATGSPAEVGCDPVSGRNQGLALTWEQISLSDEYEVQVGKNDVFSLRLEEVEPASNPFYMPADVFSPAYYINAGSLPEAGHSYYWQTRTRHAATGEVIRSPWSKVRGFTVKTGFPVSSPYLGIQLLAPDNGYSGCPVGPAFSWSPYKEATKYEFVLAGDAGLTQLVRQGTTTTTAYQYEGRLNYAADYFWRVRALEVNGQPTPSDWSATFCFRTEAAPAPQPQPRSPEAATLSWVWALLALGVTLDASLLILILRRRLACRH